MTAPSSERIHASCVAIGDAAILLVGASGSGKSDLALRLIDRGAILVADDYTVITKRGSSAFASAPANIGSKIEVRGVGIIVMAARDDVEIAMMILLDEPPVRHPEIERRTVAGVGIPALALAPFEASTPLKIELALKQLNS